MTSISSVNYANPVFTGNVTPKKGKSTAKKVATAAVIIGGAALAYAYRGKISTGLKSVLGSSASAAGVMDKLPASVTNVLNKISNVAKKAIEALKPALGKIKPIIEKVVNFAKPILEKITGLFKTVKV